jgi:hypothetical protein
MCRMRVVLTEPDKAKVHRMMLQRRRAGCSKASHRPPELPRSWAERDLPRGSTMGSPHGRLDEHSLEASIILLCLRS